MVGATIKARLELVTGGGSLGGGGFGGGNGISAQEERKFRQEEANTSKGILSALLGGFRGGFLAGAAAIGGTVVAASLGAKEIPKAIEQQKEINVLVKSVVAKKRNLEATEELAKAEEAAGMSFAGARQTLEDGSIQFVDATGNVIRKFDGFGGEFDENGFKILTAADRLAQGFNSFVNSLKGAEDTISRLFRNIGGGSRGDSRNFSPVNANFTPVSGGSAFVPPPPISAFNGNTRNQSLMSDALMSRANRTR